jgi:hypothetical protein
MIGIDAVVKKEDQGIDIILIRQNNVHNVNILIKGEHCN